ncbi:DUF4765 family protein, partial [Salmonella enterica subsp. enterica serovar Kentucky]|nr:DUF4765 family protein [Salmonella enterica subsp. enterica serovar Kentucky]
MSLSPGVSCPSLRRCSLTIYRLLSLRNQGQHERQAQALESFKEKLSSMNGGQEFVYAFNKIIQEGLGGLIE